MTDEEAFIIAANHLIKQNKKSIGSDDICLYRGPEGLMCGIGPLIPDELYHPDMEGNSPQGIQDMFPDIFKGLDLGLLRGIQGIHDDREPEDWQSLFQSLARCLGYKWECPA